MNAEDRSQVRQALFSRRDAIADSWYKAVTKTSYVPLDEAQVREHFVALTEQAIALLFTQPFERSQAEAIGASLASFHYLQPTVLGRTQEILAQQFVEGLSADQAAALQPRLAELLGGVAAGFFQQARETILTEQEQIRSALITELRRAQEALRKAYDEVEDKVQERTAELRVTNESLKREIAQRQQAEEALRESEEKYRNLVERANDGICIIQDTMVQYANPRLAEMWGGPIEEIIDTPFTNYVHPDELPKVLDRYQRRMADEDVIPIYETVLRRKDGGKVYVELNAGVVTYQGKPADLVIVRDITERKRAEEALRKSEERYRSLFEGVPVGLYRVGPDGHFLDVNPTMIKMLGYPNKESLLAITTPDLQLGVTPEDRQRRQALLERYGTLRDVEMQLRRHDGGVIWARSNFRAIQDADGQTLYYEGSLEDITERKRAEEELEGYRHHLEELVEERTAELRNEITERKQTEAALKASEERYRSLFEGVPVGLYRTTSEGQILDANAAMVQMLGYPDRESLLALNAADLYLNPDDRRREQSLLEHEGVLRDFETELHHHNGTVIWVRDSARAVCHADGQVWCYEGALEDITERKRVEEELIRLSSAVKMSVDSIVIIDVGGKVIDVNEAALRMYGTDDKQDLIGQDSLNLVAPEHRGKALAGMKFVLEKGHDMSQGYDAITRDGRRVPVELSAAVMKDADGKPIGIVTIARDITDRKRVEEHMMRTERLAAMGRLAAALAHEINNPLQAIGNSLELALDFPLPEKERQEYLQAARREIERLMVLTDRVLNFARPPLVERQATSVADVVRHALALVSKELRNSNIRVSLDLPDVLPPVLTSSSHLLQVFLNLMINAIEAMPDGGELSIVVRLAGDQVEVTFADSGPGIPPDAMARLFEPFHTTKKNGTGLGLTTSFSIIQQHGGTMTAGNAPGGGAVFTVALPVVPSDEPHVAERS